MSTLDSVPAFYKFVFLWFNPICSAWGAYMDIFQPADVMRGYNPSVQYSRTLDVLFQQIAGPFLALVFLDIFLQRYSQDLIIWKIYHAAVLIIDIVTLYSFYDVLDLQDRLPLSRWDAWIWMGVGITVVAGLIRVAFIAGVGFKKIKLKGR